MTKLNLVVVGPGLIGKEHIRLIQKNQDSCLVAIVAPDHAHNHSLAKNLNVPLFYNLTSCLDLTLVDGVLISSPNKFHAEQAKECIQRNIPVFVEKPLTSTVQEGVSLVKLAKKHGAKVLVGHHRAHSSILREAKRIIQEGRLGRLVSITGNALFYKPEEYFLAGPWRTQPGGGPILINLIHEIGNLRSLCGEILAVQAFTSSSIRNFPVEDTVSINLKFENGVLGNFILSDTAACAKSWEQTSRENPAYSTYPDEDCYVISGTLGSLSIPSFRLKYYRNKAEASWWKKFQEETIDIERKDPLACQLEHFIDVINGISTPLVSAEDGLQNLKVIEAISKSAIKNSIIFLKN